jgi:uncharacterized repeat protein (TIGR01451 family)
MTTKVKLAAVAGSAMLLVLAGSSSPRDVHASQPAPVSTDRFAAATAKTRALEALHKSAMTFEANQGQTDKRVKFISRGAGYTLFLTRDSAVMALQNAGSAERLHESAAPATSPSMPYIGDNLSGTWRGQSSTSSEAVLNMRVVGANPAAHVTASDRLEAKSNYFIGNNRAKWRTNVPNFGKVRYAGIYPGVDLVYYGNQRQLEYDFVVAPGADPNVIALRFASGPEGNGSLSSSIDNNGDLVAHLEGGNVLFRKPVVYQTDGQEHKKLIDAHYVVRGNGQVGFEVAAYDRGKQLVIDPTLSYSTYLGGSNVDVGLAVALDRFGSCFITGSTLSSDFPTMNPFMGYQGQEDVFITKFNSKATALEYSTFVGGSGDDVAQDIHLDSLGDMTVTGYTLSTDFPLKNPIQKTFGGGTVTGDAFLFQIASHGTALVFSTYLGGSSDDQGFSLAIDSSNNIYVAGHTSSTNFPVTAGALQTTCGVNASGSCSNGFALKVPSKGNVLTYSTYLGGSGGLGDSAYGIAIDTNGDAYLAGITGSPNFPTTSGAFDTTCGTDGECNGTYDGFVTEINPTGSGLVFSTFLGGSGYDYASGIALDSTGSIYVSGNTVSTDFPVTSGAAQTTFGGMSAGCVPSSTTTCGDVTITKLEPGGSSLIYSTYLGGSLDENPGISMAVDSGGSVYVTGQTDSLNFPVVNAFQTTYGGGSSDAFITKLNPAGTAFVYSSYIGGSGQDSGSRVALDASADAFISGTTVSTNFPVTAGVFQSECGTDGTCNGGLSDAFAVKVTTSAHLSVANSAPGTVASGSTLTYTILGENTGPDAATSVVLTDVVPAGTTFQSAKVNAGSCTTPPQGGTGTVTCTLGSQPKGAKLKLILVVNVTASSGTVITDTVTISSASPDPDKNNSATVNTTVD